MVKAVEILLDTGNLLKHTIYVARNDPRWKSLCLQYTRGNPRTFTSRNKDTTSGKDMYGAGMDMLSAIAQKLALEKLEFKYGTSPNQVASSVSFIVQHEQYFFLDEGFWVKKPLAIATDIVTLGINKFYCYF